MTCSRLVICDCQCPSWPYVGKWYRLLRNRTLISIASLWSGSIWSSLDGSWHSYLALQLWHSSAVLESLLWQLLWWVMESPVYFLCPELTPSVRILILEVWHHIQCSVISERSHDYCNHEEYFLSCVWKISDHAVIYACWYWTHHAYYVCVFQKLGIFLQKLVNALSKPCHIQQWN